MFRVSPSLFRFQLQNFIYSLKKEFTGDEYIILSMKYWTREAR